MFKLLASHIYNVPSLNLHAPVTYLYLLILLFKAAALITLYYVYVYYEIQIS